jgi:hypothetical protein
VLDVDYHHGNGTQDIFLRDPGVFFASLHADPATDFPFYWGHADERGEGEGIGATLNLPLPRGTGWADYAPALGSALDAIGAWGAAMLVVSFGADTFAGDPISHFRLERDDFARLGAAIAERGLPTLVVMEGGYAVAELGANVAAFLSGLRLRLPSDRRHRQTTPAPVSVPGLRAARHQIAFSAASHSRISRRCSSRPRWRLGGARRARLHPEAGIRNRQGADLRDARDRHVQQSRLAGQVDRLVDRADHTAGYAAGAQVGLPIGSIARGKGLGQGRMHGVEVRAPRSGGWRSARPSSQSSRDTRRANAANWLSCTIPSETCRPSRQVNSDAVGKPL